METTINALEADITEDIQVGRMIRLAQIAETQGDLSELIEVGELTQLGGRVIDDYEQDLAERCDWERIVKRALENAAQEKERGEKTFPWHRASDVNYPLLTVGGLQFNARAYPAIVRGDEAASVKVVGSDKGSPQIGPDGQPMGQMGPDGQPQPMWRIAPGAKAKRASRVKEYLNTQLFYKIEGWEADTDLLLMQLPIVGCAFRKVYYNPSERKHCVRLVSALNLVAPMATRDCRTAARLSEILPLEYPYETLEKIRAGYYRSVEFLTGVEYTETPRQMIEQHCRYDLDGDGYPEPYIVTVDLQSREVLRVVANFAAQDIQAREGRVVKITPNQFYVKYGFFPHPEGKFYDLGLGHLLDQIGGVIDTIINQMLDAGTAQVAGGGFIGSGVRLQGSKRSNVIRMAPGEWKPVNVPGDALRNAMVERTVPNVSPVMFQMLELLLGAAQDISAVKDVLTGEAKNTGQVGTTLALIEQGLQMFTAIYKRVYRGLKEEYQLLFANIGKYADEATAEEYRNLLDDPEADFQADFQAQDMDIRPVSDPQTVTNMQKMSRAQFMGQFLGAPGVDSAVIIRRMLEAADIDDIDEVLPKPDPMAAQIQQATVQKEFEAADAAISKDNAQAQKFTVDAEVAAQGARIATQDAEMRRLEKLAETFQRGFEMGQ